MQLSQEQNCIAYTDICVIKGAKLYNYAILNDAHLLFTHSFFFRARSIEKGPYSDYVQKNQGVSISTLKKNVKG